MLRSTVHAGVDSIVAGSLEARRGKLSRADAVAVGLGIPHVRRRWCLLHGKGWAVVRQVVPGGWFSIVGREDPLLPTFNPTDSIVTVRAVVELDGTRLMGSVSKDFRVLCELADAVEARNKLQEDETVRIHVFPEVKILAEVIDREVVVHLHRHHAHDRVLLNVRRERYRAHGLQSLILVCWRDLGLDLAYGRRAARDTGVPAEGCMIRTSRRARLMPVTSRTGYVGV